MRELTIAERVDGAPAVRWRQRVIQSARHAAGRLEVIGLEHVPTHGPVVVAVNHRSALDGPLVFGLVERPVNFLVKIEAFTPTMAPALRGAGQIPIRRDRVDRGAIRLCLDVLGAGGIVGIFPEGSRGDGLVGVAKPGVGYLALRAGAAVVPVACHGTDQMSHRRSLRRPAALVAFGPPIPVEPYPGDRPLNKRVVAAHTERIRVALADLVASTAQGAVAA